MLLLKCYPKILDGKFRLILLLIGAALLLIAGIGKLGWHSGITTYDGDSSSEKLNDAIFVILSYLGTFCIFLDLSLHYLKIKSKFVFRSFIQAV